MSRLSTARRLVVKIGSALLVDADGALRTSWLAALARDLAEARARGTEVVVVTSGAVALGRGRLGLGRRPLKLEEKQAAAAAGQIPLYQAWIEALAGVGLIGAQVLLTPDDTEERRRHLNARATLLSLADLGAVPIINENDTVATAEIRFGDNDRLAARVAQMMSADTLVLLSDIDGLYTADPRKDPLARHLTEVPEITPEILAMAGEAPPGYSSGGMVTKLAAARIAVAAGCAMVIALGKGERPLHALMSGARCTWFLPQAEPLTQRKRWIAGHVKPHGTLTVDDGAVRALARGASLLPAGVRRVAGSFGRGDLVEVLASDGRRLGVGLSAYGADEAERILGHRSGDIEAILGYRGRDEMIHRDDLVLDPAMVAATGG
ncbi:MAG: glutamate 5-kinase [Alphaproteobacteria bacterium]|nr:glutamate 5-kinase [Alphaproteobacteria bacterium]TAD90077.1 MAG: glutamate 5-kinase [Alphaproteobacteria bacterium]